MYIHELLPREGIYLRNNLFYEKSLRQTMRAKMKQHGKHIIITRGKYCCLSTNSCIINYLQNEKVGWSMILRISFLYAG